MIDNLTGAVADLFARAWTVALKDEFDARSFGSWTERRRATFAAVGRELAPIALARPQRLSPGWATDGVVGALAKNAEMALSAEAHRHDHGKLDAYVSREVRPLLDEIGVREWLESIVGLDLSENGIQLQYAQYDDEGSYIHAHLDTANYGRITMILCL